MTTSLLIQSKDSGTVYECSDAVSQVTVKTVRTGTPGTLTFRVIKAGNLSFVEGDPVRFEVDGQLQFYGWVFTKKKDRWGVIDVTCYDRLRYLKANASYAFYAMNAGDIIRQIAGDFGLDVGAIADTGYLLPSLIESDQPLLDIIGEAVQQTLLNTGKAFVFYDNGAGLSLQEAGAMTATEVVGDKSRLLDYTYTTDIDKQTYNSIKLARPNEDSGGADVVLVEDSETIGKWGLLQLYQQVDGDLNLAQMEAQALSSLMYYNRRMRTVSFEALGVLGLRAGQMLYMDVPGLGDINLKQYVLLEQVTHTFENSVHKMSVETMPI